MHALLDDSPPPPRVGFIVTKTVGIAVQRNRVKRRLRALAHSELAQLPGGRVVIRALPASTDASFTALRVDVRTCVDRFRTQQR